ncbi:3-phosphoglycerate dehydrogenase family protein [Kamptonema cortianum]|nr:3-phosphoglycerate dehydrogenase family protein [Geitlerinema splendidum]MDK3160441.1 3-phosphoglycerate dehydrogenase family protein [Kamptonema cortianum]
MKVLVADKLEVSALEGLKQLGCEVVSEPTLDGESLIEKIGSVDPDVLVVRSTKVPKAAIEAGKSISLIIRAGAGYNTIDVEAASEKGVYVANCPGKNSIAVAELAFGLILACDRMIADNVIELRRGKWNKKAFSKGKGLYGSTLGLIGMGNIAQEMIPRAKAFGMNVMAFSRWMMPEAAAALGIARAESLKEIAEQCDAISVHVALSPQTKGILDQKFFDSMKPGAIFVNTSRAEVVDQAALIAVVQAGKIRAGLDVFEGEPSGGEGDYAGELCDIEGIYCTHHIGASTEQAQEAVAAEVVRIVHEYKQTGIVPNVVNISKGAAVSNLLVVRHQDKVGVLAHVLDVLKSEGVSVQEMENIILGSAKSAIAQIALDKEVSPTGLAAIRSNTAVFDVVQLPA